MANAVIVGGGPGAVQAAGALRALGRHVVLLQEGPVAGQLTHAEVPVGRGVAESGGERLTDWRPVDVDRGVLVHDRVIPLPMRPNHLFRAMPPRVHPEAARAFAKARANIQLREFIGGGREQRSYRDWVVQRFGEPVFRQLYAPYCTKRFGDPTRVTANAARRVHAGESGTLVAPVQGAGVAVKAALAGVEVRTDVVVTGLEAGRVLTTAGVVEGDVFVDVPPPRAVAWMPDNAALVHEVERLESHHAIEVIVAGGAELPFETHVVDERAAFFRLIRAGRLPGNPDVLVAHYAVGGDDPRWELDDATLVSATVGMLRAIGVRDAEAGLGAVRRIAEHHPVWSSTHHARMRVYLLALERLGITPVGRAGLHMPLSEAESADWLGATGAGGGLRERYRMHLEPKVGEQMSAAKVTDFIVR